MSTRWTLAGATMLLLAVGTESHVVRASADPYTVQDLGVPASPSVALGVNAAGVAVGWNYAASRFDGFRQASGGAAEVLPPFSDNTQAVGINDAGQIGGHGFGSLWTHPFRLDANASAASDLDPSGAFDQAYGIDAAGRVVGYSYSAAGAQATRWDGGTPLVIGGRPGAGFSVAYGTSENGLVVGVTATATPGEQQAFKWTEAGGHTFLASLGGAFSEGRGANTAGDVVGVSTQPGGGDFVAVRWPAAGGDPVPLAGMTRAYDINNRGQIVGVGLAPDESDHAFLFEGGVAVDLNTLIDDPDWTLTRAYAINDAGQIVGEGIYQNVQRGFLLTPPSTADTTAPVISTVTASPNAVWPPNHQLVTVVISVDASDDSGEPPACGITGVTSSDGSAAKAQKRAAVAAAALVGPLSVQVRAERSAPTQERIYTVAVSCADAAGNSSTAEATVRIGK